LRERVGALKTGGWTKVMRRVIGGNQENGREKRSVRGVESIGGNEG